MPESDGDGRSPLARGYVLATQVTTMGVEVAAPILIGYWLDQRWQTGPACVLIGVFLGFGISLYSILQLARRKP